MKRAFAFFLVCLVLTGYISAAGEAVSVEEFVASEAMEEPAAEIELDLFEESSPTQAAPETELMAPEPEQADSTASPQEAAQDAAPQETAQDDTQLEAVQETPKAEPAPTVISVKKKAKRTVYIGTKYQIKVPGKKVKSFKSSAKKIAKVSKSGLVTPKKAGKVKITIRLSKKKSIVLTLKVVDPTAPTKVVINEGKKASIYAGETLQLSTVVSPETAKQNVTWTSSKKAVATVDGNGLVTAVKAGKATITATTSNKKKATFTLTVIRVPRPVANPYMISHAMGGVDGKNYSNCLEAFLENYAEGHRVFEVDMELTSDGKIVLCHGWNRKLCSRHKKGYRPTYAQFMSYKIYNKYTPMSLEDLLKLMNKYPDIRVITDTRYAKTAKVKKQFTMIVSTAKRLGLESVLDQFTVEIYNQSMLQTVENIHHFKSYVFTLYKLLKKSPTAAQLRTIGSFCAKNGVGMVAMYAHWWKAEFAEILDPYNVEIGLYTVNSVKDAQVYLDDGVTAMCTDFLSPIK